MAKLIYGLSQSLDGYVDHDRMAPGPELFRYFIEHVGALTGAVYGRHVYELMQYWQEDDPQWSDDDREFAIAWRRLPKWVVSRTLTTVGPNAALIKGDLEPAIRTLKTSHSGEIEVAGPVLAQSLTDLGLIDEYQLIMRPIVLGHGAPFFAGPTPPLRLAASDRIGEDAIRLTYVPA
jgi:dihydrofolate reductase